MRIGYIDRACPNKIHVFTGKTNPEKGKIGTAMDDLKGLGNIYIVKVKGKKHRVLVTRYI